MPDIIIPSGQVNTDGVELLNPGDSVTVEGQIIADPGVLIQSSQNLVDVELGGVIQSDGTAIQAEGIDSTITNDGLIDGAFNGINVENGGQFSATIFNNGTITSDSRAINLGGLLNTVVNTGEIRTDSSPRNGTIYGDVTAPNIVIRNLSTGTVDVGEGNDGDAISLELGSQVSGEVFNEGTIYGRGVAVGNNQSSAVRLYLGGGVQGTSTFTGSIVNAGLLSAENGPAVVIEDGVVLDGSIINSGTIESTNPQNGVGIRLENGSQLNGEIVNTGLINGGRDGISFDNGGQVSGIVRNLGTITSTSRAINIGGNQNTIINEGLITTSDSPRNGTVYSDVTANNYSVQNLETGIIDVGEGNDGDAIAFELGANITGSIINAGLIQGRGVAIGENQSAAIQLYHSPSEPAEISVFNGNIENSGILAAENGAALFIDDAVRFNGQIINTGTILGGLSDGGLLAIEASNAQGNITIINQGTIEGDVNLTGGQDLYDGSQGVVTGTVFGNGRGDRLIGGRETDRFEGGGGRDRLVGRGGDDILSGGVSGDTLLGGAGDDILLGGGGNDTLRGGSGNDLLDGGPGNDILIGGGGADIFVLSRGAGSDFIRDFRRADSLGLSGQLSFDDLTFEQDGRNLLIRAGRDQLATLRNTSLNSISESDFVSV
ncbi:MAG: hypothetical protein ACFE0I_14760 [Elainellaceae cyanobacterium]